MLACPSVFAAPCGAEYSTGELVQPTASFAESFEDIISPQVVREVENRAMVELEGTGIID
eukprot:2708504-Pyramimonas_sp.AAC.1